MVGQVKLRYGRVSTDGSAGRTMRELLEQVRLVVIEVPLTALDEHFRDGGRMP